MDPKIISLDIETYGAAAWCKPQTVFTPRRSLTVDGIHPSHVVQTCSITLPTRDPRTNGWDATAIANLEPGSTMVFEMWRPEDRRLLTRWLAYADTIIGMNLQYDLSYLRAFHLPYRALLNSRHHLIDLSYVNYLHNELRPERSLKSLGPILGTHAYKEVAADRFHNPEKLKQYNAQDTHNTLLAISTLARRILTDHPDTDKLSSWCVKFYTDTIWSCVKMSENGVPFHRPNLERFAEQLKVNIRTIERALRRHHRLYMSKASMGGRTGSAASKQDFLEKVMDEIDRSDSTQSGSVRDHPNLVLTDKRKEVSFNDENRNLFRLLLPRPHPYQQVLSLIASHSRAQKLLGSYCYPLLWHQRNKPAVRSSTLVGRPDHPVWTSHPSWFIVPSSIKDGGGSEGGTQQGRIVCKNGAHQTDPPEIQACRRSRFQHGVLLGIDLSQIELRVAALLSGEPSMLREYAKPKPDIHGNMAIAIFGPDVVNNPDWKSGDMTKDPRQWGKVPNFLILFRGGPDKLQLSLLDMSGILFPLSVCRRHVQAARDARPILWAWQDDLIAHTHLHGKIVLPFTGQSRLFGGGDAYDVNEIVNFPIQTTAGNTLLRIQAYIHHRIKDDPDILMFLNVYDALYFDCRDSTAADRAEVLFEEAVEYVTTRGYWSWLQEHYGRTVPLQYEAERK